MAFGTVKLDSITTSTQTLTADNLLENADIGVSVQAYDANLPAGNVIVVDADIGSTVQAYNAKLAAVAGLAVTDGNIIVGNGSTFVAENGATARTSLGLAIGSDVQAYDADTAKTDVAQTFTAQQTFGEIKEGVFTLGTSGSVAVDPANGSIQISVLTGTLTLTDSLESGQSVVLHLEAGSNTVQWPTITWTTSAGNSAPTLTAKDVVVFWKISSTLYGAYVGSYA